MEGGLLVGQSRGRLTKSIKINYYETFDNQQSPSGQHERSVLPGLLRDHKTAGRVNPRTAAIGISSCLQMHTKFVMFSG